MERRCPKCKSKLQYELTMDFILDTEYSQIPHPEKIKISSKLLRLAKRVIKEKRFADKKTNAQDKNKPTALEKTKQ